MISAAAEVKPIITCSFKTISINLPAFAKERATWKMPTLRASITANEMYIVWSPSVNDDTATAVNRLTIATGPVARYLEEPKNAATATGIKDAYNP